MNYYSFTVAVGWLAAVLGVVVAFAQFKPMSQRGATAKLEGSQVEGKLPSVFD